MPASTDRRVRRTRRLLHQSLIALILEKGYGRITVQDILDRADIGRSTFYTHYRDKEDLLLDGGLDHLRAILTEPTTPQRAIGVDDVLRPALTLFRLVDGNRRLYQAMIGSRGSDRIVRSAKAMLSDVLTEHLRARLPEHDQRPLDVSVAFLVSGLLGLLTWWLDEQVALTPDEMYRRFEDLAACGVGPLLNNHPAALSHADHPHQNNG